MIFLSDRSHIRGNIGFFHLHPCLILIYYCLHPDKVYNSVKIIFSPYGNLYWHGICTESFSHLLESPKEIASYPVHLIYKGKPWHVVSICLSPDSLSLRLNPANRTKDNYTSIQDPE